MKYLFVFAVLLVSCRVIKPTDKENAWNGYKDDCRSLPVNHVWPLGFSKKRSHYIPVKPGIIILNNNDTIKGLINFLFDLHRTMYVKILPDNSSGRINEWKPFFPNSSITHIRIFKEPLNQEECVTDFYNLSNKYNLENYWRMLGKRNNISIYDNFRYNNGDYNSDNAFLTKMVLTNYNQCLTLYQWRPFNSTKGSLKRFINKRYKANVHKSDFKTIRQMIDYILDKENEKEALESKGVMTGSRRYLQGWCPSMASR